MTERERLIELICKAFSDKNNVLNGGTIRGGKSFYLSTHLADYLIANGVRLPVACGECELCNDFGHEGWCKRFDTRVGTDGYCHYGERRADNG